MNRNWPRWLTFNEYNEVEVMLNGSPGVPSVLSLNACPWNSATILWGSQTALGKATYMYSGHCPSCSLSQQTPTTWQLISEHGFGWVQATAFEQEQMKLKEAERSNPYQVWAMLHISLQLSLLQAASPLMSVTEQKITEHVCIHRTGK